jgi:hypothetical protein
MSNHQRDKAEPRPRQQQAEAPAGTLTWRSPQERKRLLALWRDAICHRASRFQIKLAWVICDDLNWKGATGIGDFSLTSAVRCSRRKVQEGLKGLEEMGAIIRLTKMGPNGKRTRRMFPGAAILGSSQKGTCPISGRNPLRPPGGHNPYTPPRGAHIFLRSHKERTTASPDEAATASGQASPMSAPASGRVKRASDERSALNRQKSQSDQVGVTVADADRASEPRIPSPTGPTMPAGLSAFKPRRLTPPWRNSRCWRTPRGPQGFARRY